MIFPSGEDIKILLGDCSSEDSAVLSALFSFCAAKSVSISSSREIFNFFESSICALATSSGILCISVISSSFSSTFSYTPERKILKNISVDVKQGQHIALVGPTGAGKTTIINLLMRFYDVDGGAVKMEGTDIRHAARASVRRSYTMVLQDTWLFSGTIADNIAYGSTSRLLQ